MNIYIHPEIIKLVGVSWKDMKLQKFKVEILKCVILNDICSGILYGNINPYKFVIDVDKYCSFLNTINSKYDNPYREVQRIIKSLHEYIFIIERGYSLQNTCSFPSLYSITDSFLLFLDKLERSKKKVIEYNLDLLSYGVKSDIIYEYEHKKYESINDILKQFHCNFGEYSKLKKKISSKVKKIKEYRSGLTSCIVNNINKGQFKTIIHKEAKLDTVISHSTLLNIDSLHSLINSEETLMDITKQRILHSIELKTSKSGKIIQEYYRGVHGRLYQHGYSLQMLPSDYRKALLSNYDDVDIKSATYSILWNYAQEYGIPESEYPTLCEYVKDPDGFREHIHSMLLFDDEKVTFQYVKDIMNSVAFGARFSEALILNDILHGTQKTVPVATKGYGYKSTPLNVVNIREIKSLIKELKTLTHIFESKLSDGTYLTNEIGQQMKLEPRMQYGKKLAHIYQGAESRVLLTIINYDYNGKPLYKNKYAVGLLLHDGVYINKNITPNLDISDYVYNKLGYKIKFSY